MFRFTAEEIENMERVVNNWIKLKEDNENEIIAVSDSISVRKIKIKDQNIEVGMYVCPNLEEVYEKIRARDKLNEEVNTSKTDDPYFDSKEFNEEWDRVMAREERHEKREK
jgi:type I restriction-modification system DNA methylase subunit